MPQPFPADAKTVSHLLLRYLSVPLQVESIVPLPRLSSASSCLVVSVALAKTPRLLASCCKATRFAMLVYWLHDPVDARVTTNSLVLRIDENDLEILVSRVLVDPVGIENS